MHYKSIIRLLSYVTFLMAVFLLLPAVVAAYYGEEECIRGFLLTSFAMLVVSSVAVLISGSVEKISIGVKDSYLFVTLTWFLLAFFGALPFYFTGVFDSFAGCFFESMSGFTATGASMMGEIDTSLKGILFWRSMTNWIGGMGIVLLFIAVLPSLGVSGASLYGAEMIGPTKEKLLPLMKDTALVLWALYRGLSVLQVVFLFFGGLDWFDAMTIMFATMGSAGFAPHSASIAYYDSVYVNWVCIIFMFLAAVNFSLFFHLLRGKFRKVFSNYELKLYFTILCIATLLVTCNLVMKGFFSLPSAFNHAAFQVVSFMTTTGFVSADYSSWPFFSQMVLYILCIIGGCAGSTSGGIKVIRVGAMLQIFRNAMIKRLHPSAVVKIHIGSSGFSTDTVQAIAGFTGFYFANIILGTLVLSLTGFDFLITHSAVLLALTNVGVGFGGLGTSVSFSIFPDWALSVLSFLMLAGRLELFTVYSIFTRDFWRR